MVGQQSSEIEQDISKSLTAEMLKMVGTKWAPFKKALNDLCSAVTASTKTLERRVTTLKSSKENAEKKAAAVVCSVYYEVR